MMRDAGITLVSAMFLFFFIVVGSETAISAEAPIPPSDVTFAEKPTFQSDDSCTFGLTEDKKAFELQCTSFETTVEVSKLPARVAQRARLATSNAPVATRVFSFVLPITGGKPIKVPFSVSGFIATTEGAYGTLIASVNGQNTVVRFPSKSDREFVRNFLYKAKSASEIRLTLFLLAERDSKFPDAATFLNVTVVSAGKEAK